MLQLASDADGSALQSCQVPSYGRPALVDTCTMTRSSTLLSVEVRYVSCVMVARLGQRACLDQGN